MMRASFLFAIAACTLNAIAESPGGSVPERSTVTAIEAQRLLKGHCDLVASTASLPKTLRNAFAKITNEPEFSLANPGEKYQETDVIDGPKLPWRRMVIAGSCDGNWFVHYEQGGIGHSYKLVLFRPDSKLEMEFVWGGVGFHKAGNCDELRRAIATKRFASDRRYYW